MRVIERAVLPPSEGRAVGMKEMKEAYVAKMEAQMKEWGAHIREMKAKAEKAAAQGRIDYQQKLEQARAQEKQEMARRKLEELKLAGEERWEALKAGVEGAWSELRAAGGPKNPKDL
jgi:hypothetical protein